MSRVNVGDKIVFANEPHVKYTVKATNERFTICTRPFNIKKTVFYTIIDWEAGIRSTNDFVFNFYGYKDINDINQCLADLTSGKCGLSRRNQVELIIISVTS